VPALLVRRGGRVLAVENWCPHAGGPLSEGKFEGDVVECPWHQSRFCLTDGAPLQGPAAVPLRTFEVQERGGRILIRPSFEGQSWPPPPEPARAAPQFVPIPNGETHAHTDATTME
jgi:nitrite reductase/ring-hydroxylating ferredoxin subunit